MKLNLDKIHTKASVLMDLGQWDDCVTYLEGFEDKSIFDWRVFWDLGWSYYKLNRFDMSANSFQFALDTCPKNNNDKALCFGFLGLSYLEMDSLREAELNLRESLNHKDASITRYALALCLMKQNKIDEAESIHIEGLNISPKNKDRLKAYADFLSDIERFDEARELYRMIKK